MPVRAYLYLPWIYELQLQGLDIILFVAERHTYEVCHPETDDITFVAGSVENRAAVCAVLLRQISTC